MTIRKSWWPFPPKKKNPDDWKNNTCSQCGLELRPVMWYVCYQSNCPTGLGGFTC